MMTSTPKTEKCGQESDGDPGSGHRGSLRGANKLARRARSFKDDLLERISNMRSPGQQHHPPHLSSALRSHSPLSPRLRNSGTKAAEEGEVTPAKELERLVKEVTFGLRHFSDVISKRKLEMLPDNGTIVFESIANIHKAIKPYCNRSSQLMNAVTKLCTSLAMLIRLCDDITALSLRADANNEEVDSLTSALSTERVSSVVKGVTSAVEEVAALAQQHMTRPALSPRPPLVSPRPPAHRNSLPDIPNMPNMNESPGVRASHSSESVLDDTPPPKPSRPNRKIDVAPPLPPKRKSANDNPLLPSIDRLSLQSHSSGSLDSMLNVCDEQRHLDNSHDSSDVIGLCNCINNGTVVRTSQQSDVTNHNRFSNESGFVSVGHSEISTEHHSFASSYSSQHFSGHTDSSYDSTDCITEMKCTMQSFESRMNVLTHHSSVSSSMLSGALGEAPPQLPAKTRRNIRADLQQHFPSVEIRQAGAGCALHGEARPHTLAEHHPPPLPLKKKHIMAYMEMFGNCSHPPTNVAAAPDLFRHSIHTYNLASSQQGTAGGLSTQRHQQVQRSIAQSVTVQHFGTPPLSGSDDSVNHSVSGAPSPVPAVEPPALPPKMNKTKQIHMNSSNELLPPPSPRPSSHNSTSDETMLNDVNSEDSFLSTSTPGKFPLEEELDLLVQQPPTPSPVPSQRSEISLEQSSTTNEVNNTTTADPNDIILQTDVSSWLSMKVPGKDGSNKDAPAKEGHSKDVHVKEVPQLQGGHPDALIVLATKATKDFAYQEAFLATYRTWVSPSGLVARLVKRAHHFQSRTHELRSTLSLLTRVVADLTLIELDSPLMTEIMEFIYWLVEAEELAISKALRQIIVDKQKQLHFQPGYKYEYDPPPCYGSVSLRRDSLLDFKSTELAEQMTLLDAELFSRISTAEVLSWPCIQSEERTPNLTRFTEHFNKMSYWARSRILEQEEPKERERYASKFLKVMKALRKMNNFNSYLALLAALDSPPIHRLWPQAIKDTLTEYCAIIDSKSSFAVYRKTLAETHPPCIPYIGLVLQDLTFIHIGNPDLRPDGTVNFTKRWQQNNIMENMKRFQKDRQYKFKKNERIQAMFNGFLQLLSEEAMWQISLTLKPRETRNKPDHHVPQLTSTPA